MPTIRTFAGCRIYMYFEDHNPPHFHVIGPDFDAKVGIEDMKVIAGNLPPKGDEAIRWARKNRKHLMEAWQRYRG